MMSPGQDLSDADSEMDYGTPDEGIQTQAQPATHPYQDSSGNLRHSMPQHSHTSRMPGQFQQESLTPGHTPQSLPQELPQTPPPREDHHMGDLNETPRAPDPNDTPRASSSSRDQPPMREPLSPTIQLPRSGKRRKVQQEPQAPNDDAQSNSQRGPGPSSSVDALKTLFEAQATLLKSVCTQLQGSTTEMLQKQDEKTAAILQKQDDKIDRLAEHTNQNSRMLARIGETLEMHFTGKPAQRRGNMGDEQGAKPQGRGNMGDKRGAKPQGDAAPTGRKPSDRVEEQDNEGDDEADVGYAFSYAKKKRVRRSGEIKRRPVEELRSKELIRVWLDQIMKGQDQLKNTVTQHEADEYAEAFKKNPLSRPCTTEDFRYWIAGGPKSAWNKGASYVFVEILEKQKLITKPSVEDRDGLREAFLVRLKSLHKYWLEDKKMAEDSDDSPLPTGRWQRKSTSYLKIFDELGVAGMSSDEEDPGMSKPRVQYIVKGQRWRAALVKNFVRPIDFVHLEGRCSADGNKFSFTRGSPPRLRVDNNDRSSNSKYVVGLPSNFYDAEWLEEMEPGWSKGGYGFVNEILRPQKPMKLVFPPDLAKMLQERKDPGGTVY
ncbi:protein [Lentinula edodes]|uniref:Protein n=1 Tax=Lentinula edodes TaxID=5353 RepID=A0A1Q3EBS2_LENED|nr:protein [Lentinula edodes]